MLNNAADHNKGGRAKGEKMKKFTIEVAEKKGLDQECACCPGGQHQYSANTCECGREFCYSCCGGTNVDQGGKYDPDYMLCPSCGRDFYAPEKAVNAA
jgi:hypothetical protein